MTTSLEDFRRGISSIPKQERRALILYEILGYSYKEIAKILRVEVNTVGVYLHRAREQYFSELDDNWWCMRWTPLTAA